jgi:exopolyphosphatase/guanosine-5'-triphosphate,3'-diphosphate pyrophosphatase
MAEANKVDLIIATATSAVRESHNSDEFIERVRAEVGLEVELLPGVEEARLIAMAVSEVTDFNDRRALIIDIGGGSTEFIITRGGEPELLLSLRVGTVRLTEKFITTDPVSSEERERLIANIRTDLTRAVWEINKVGFDFVIGTSGTTLNMVEGVAQAEAAYLNEAEIDFEPFSQTVSLEQVARMNERLAKLTVKERRKVPGFEKGRADIIIAGGLLLETIRSELGARERTSCDWSLREGVILNYLRNRALLGQDDELPTGSVEGERGPRRPALDYATRDVRTRSVLSVARRFEYDEEHSHHVARLAARIFDDTEPLHRMGESERKMLQYAALLHDIGYHIAHNNHHRHGLYLIKNSEMPGFTGNDIAMMAALVRYHRGSMPSRNGDARSRREHEDYYLLDRPHRSVMLRLAAILQIADGLDRCHRQAISEVRCEVNPNKVSVTVEAEGECDLEMWAAERKAEWFRDIFQVAVSFNRASSPQATEHSGAATLA